MMAVSTASLPKGRGSLQHQATAQSRYGPMHCRGRHRTLSYLDRPVARSDVVAPFVAGGRCYGREVVCLTDAPSERQAMAPVKHVKKIAATMNSRDDAYPTAAAMRTNADTIACANRQSAKHR